MVITRTEGHRILSQSALDAQKKAVSKGADLVKKWSAALDGNTRPNHRILDGQLKEIDEPFEVAGMKVEAPGMFGNPTEDCNCRCALQQRARWSLDEKELQVLKDRAKYFGLDKTEDFERYKEKYLKASVLKEADVDSGTELEKLGDSVAKILDTGIINSVKTNLSINLQFFAEKDIKNQESNSLKRAIRKYKVQIKEHENKISDPEKYIENWNELDVRKQEGLKKHWKKENRNFNESIQNRVNELKDRGDYDGE
jgi:uncharacterized protein with gpF-like domain